MGFRLKSGNTTSFKNMGGTEQSPAKHRLTKRVKNKVDFDRLPKSYPRDHAVEIEHEHPKDEKKGDSIKTEQGIVISDKEESPAKDMKTGSYKQSFESPAKQKSTKGGEGQDQNKILDNKGNHIGNWVNDKKVMFNDKPAVDPKAKSNKWALDPAKQALRDAWQPAYPGADYSKEEIKKMSELEKQQNIDGYEPKKKKSPAKQTKDTFADGSKKSARDKFNDTETAIEQRKADRKDNQRRFTNKGVKTIVGEKSSGLGPRAKNSGMTRTQAATNKAEMKGIDPKSPYWYKVNGKTVSKNQYLNYENKPGGDEPGKQTNHPDVYGRIKNNHGRGPKTK